MRRHALCLFVSAALAAFFPMGAQSAPSTETLVELHTQQEQSRQLTAELQAQMSELVEEQQQLKEQLVTLATALQKQEQRLADISAQEKAADEEVTAALAELNARRSELEAMIQAAVRLSQIPPQAMVMMPDMSSETMQIARTMSIMATTLKQRAHALQEQIAALHEARKRLEKARVVSEKQLAKVRQQRDELNVVMKERAAVGKELAAQIGKEKSRMSELSKRASSLKQLLAEIEKKEQARLKKRRETPIGAVQEFVEAAISKGGKKGSIRPFSSVKGKLRAPTAGRLIGKYNAKSTAELSKGLVIETVKHASVNAPYDGKVAYTGKFRGYGNMVIIKHSEDYYTLLAGLGDITASEGEVLLEGEPLGRMGGDTKLYVELRRDSEPMNPAHWFAGM